MAQLDLNQGKGGRTKRVPRIDMTAMVDVAFLLLTFFILTTSMITPKALETVMPAEGVKDLACSKIMQVYLGEANKVYWFPSCEPALITTTDYSPSGIREAVFKMQAEVEDLIISIKASDRSRFENMVDILDEMKITGARKYAISEMTPADNEILSIKGLK